MRLRTSPLAALSVFAAAALHSAASAADVVGARGSGEVTTAPAASFAVRWTSSPAPLPTNELFELLVEVSVDRDIADDGNPIWLSVDARMPGHAHGMNTRPKVQALGGGRFVVKGMLLHMAGEWEITFDVAKGRIREQATAALSLE